ncbi:MAG: hypothetical protein JWM98_1801 [Thermoleophilia bacterium]|nr:hypothetical protein [Thermoleophilia bacterium]
MKRLEPPYTGAEMTAARTAAMRALEDRGWKRVEFCGLYQPVYVSPEGGRWVQLVRILHTPRYELAPIAQPTAQVPHRRLDYPVEYCETCDMPVVVAQLQGHRARRIVVDAGYTGSGRIRLAPALGAGDVPIVVATYDRDRQFGHVEHSATCRPSSVGRTA